MEQNEEHIDKSFKVLNNAVKNPTDFDCRDCLEPECFKYKKSPNGICFCPALQEVVQAEEDLFIIVDK